MDDYKVNAIDGDLLDDNIMITITCIHVLWSCNKQDI